MEFSRKKNVVTLLMILLPVLGYFSFVLFAKYQPAMTKMLIDKVYSKDYVYTKDTTSKATAPSVIDLPKPLENPPSIIKAVYVTGWSAGTKSYLDYLNKLFANTQINAVVIDVKDSTGIVSYATGAPKAKEYNAYRQEIPDINALVNQLHSQGIYVIGRIVVFEDTALAKSQPALAVYDKSKTQDVSKPVLWTDNNNLSWVDPSSPEVWDYNIAIAQDALMHGFDEINFDYVRFPTDGNSGNMGFPLWDQKTPKNFVIKSFFQTLRKSLPGAKISADVFGQTTTNTDDMGIGQIFEDSLESLDYVCPMVYPSHYINGFLKYANPADHPYEIIKNALDSAIARQKVYAQVNNAKNGTSVLAKIRPWLQDFNLGAIYNAGMVEKEIKAVTDSTGTSFSGFLLWNPSNIYTQEAIAKTAVAPN